MAEQKLPEKAQETEMKREKVRVVPIKYIDDSPDHPFQVRDDEEMMSLVESIATFGVITPVIARKTADERYELISGHRRKRACELLHIDTLPIIVRDLSREEGIILMVDSNLQREHILPSEKAFAYKMKMEALKRTAGRPSKDNSTPVAGNLRGKETADVIGENSGESGDQVRRYIRLTELIPQLLQMVDEGKIAFRPAVELSYLEKEEQEDLLETIESEDCTPSLAQAIRMKGLSRDNQLDMDKIFEIMTEEKANLMYAVTGDSNIMDAYAIEQTISRVKAEMDNAVEKCSKTEGDVSRFLEGIGQLNQQLVVLREQLAQAKKQSSACEAMTADVERIKKMLSDDTIRFDEYDDMYVRALVDCIKVNTDDTLTIVIKGGLSFTVEIPT